MLQLPRPYIQFLPLALLALFPSALTLSTFTLPTQFEAAAKEINLAAQTPAECAAAANTASEVLVPDELSALLGSRGPSAHAEISGEEPLRLAELSDGGKEPALLTRLLLERSNAEPLPMADESLANRFAEAKASQSAGNLPQAFVTAVRLVDVCPNPRLTEVRAALDMIRELPKVASDEQLNIMETQVPELRASLTSPWALDYLNTFYEIRAKRCAERGDTSGESAYLDTFAAEAWQLVTAYPNMIIGYWNVGKYAKTMNKLGRKEEAETVLNDFASTAPYCAARVEWWTVQAEAAQEAKEYAKSEEYYKRLLSEVEHGGLDGVFSDPAVEDHSLAAREYNIAYAYQYVDEDIAFEWFKSIAERYPIEPKRANERTYAPVLARWAAADWTARRNPDAPNEGIKALYDFIQEVPESPHVPNVLTRIGRLYTEAGNYAEAQKCFQEVVQNYGDTEWRQIAEQEIVSLKEKTLATDSVADSGPVGQE